jgi:hypothetical protein
LPDDPAAKAVTVNTDPELEQEWLRQNNLIYGCLIGIGVVLVQPFLTAPSLDLSATICVVAFSVVIRFWHTSRIAGVAVLASGLVAIGVHSAGYVRLELKAPGDPEPGAPG